MNINRDSLIAALSEYALRDLPDVDDGQSVWIKAIALVRKKDGTSSYVCFKKEPYTFCNVVLKDFGTCSAIADFEEFYPFSFLKSGYMPVFKGQKKEDRVKYLNKYNKDVDYSAYTLKELDKEIISIAIERQLKEEIWGCFKYIGLPMETVMSLPIQDRKFYIIKHNEAMEMESRQMRAAEKGNSHDSTISGEALNALIVTLSS